MSHLYIKTSILILITSSPALAMLNPHTSMLSRLAPQQQNMLKSFSSLDEPERQRIENLATTPNQWIKNNTHQLQVEAARNRVFGGNWPDERLQHAYAMLGQKLAKAKAATLAQSLKLSSSNEPLLQELEQTIFDPELPDSDRAQLLELLITSRQKPLIFKSAIEFGTSHGKPVELYDLSEIVQRQSGQTCGYHAIHNVANIMAYLSGNNPENEVSGSLIQGPPLELWKDIVISEGSGQEENIRDDDIKLLLSLENNLQPDQLTIIPNLRDWNPSLDEHFATVAQQLQNHPGTLQGFLVNTAGHIHAAKITPESRQAIISTLRQKPELQQAFIANQESNIPLSYDDENNIVQALFDANQLELIAMVRSLKETEHRGINGHWTAIAARNNNGTLQLFAADSMCNPETKNFGNMDTLQTLRDWITTDPAILQALTNIPNKLETAINVMETNRDVESGLHYLGQATDMIETTPGLTECPHYGTVIEPLVNKAETLVNQLTNE